MKKISALFIYLLLLTVSCKSSENTIQPKDTGPARRGIIVRPKAPTGDVAKGNLWLLTVGIDKYLSWPKLKTAEHDAKSMKDILIKKYYLDPSRVVELYNDQATRRNILKAFRSLADTVKPDDSVIVFYAGHGHIDRITKEGSWIPVESRIDEPTAWISNHEIKNYLNIDAIKAKHVLLISDSCFSGDFFRGSRSALPEMTDARIKEAYTRSSRQAITSGGLEPVSDAGFGGNSVFSYFLVKALKTNTKPFLLPSELFNEIRSGVGKNADQLPQFGDLYGVGGQDGGALIFFQKTDNTLHELSGAFTHRQKELEKLKIAEESLIEEKKKEQAEIARKQAELDSLDNQIAQMKERLGSGVPRSSDSLDRIILLAEEKETQGKRLEVLREKRAKEEQARRAKIEKLKRKTAEKLMGQLESDISKYQKVAHSKYAQDMKSAAWQAILNSYPEGRHVALGNIDGLVEVFGFGLENGKIISGEEKKKIEAAKKAAAEIEKRKSEIQSNIYIDQQTGLQWVRNVTISEEMTWDEALRWVESLEIVGHSDWRLPSDD
jgi:hypothetical protein